MDLPPRCTTDCVKEEVHVVLYGTPSRLTGHRPKVRVYGEWPDCYLSGTLAQYPAATMLAARH
jgi:hypothetical protein